MQLEEPGRHMRWGEEREGNSKKGICCFLFLNLHHAEMAGSSRTNKVCNEPLQGMDLNSRHTWHSLGLPVVGVDPCHLRYFGGSHGLKLEQGIALYKKEKFVLDLVSPLSIPMYFPSIAFSHRKEFQKEISSEFLPGCFTWGFLPSWVICKGDCQEINRCPWTFLSCPLRSERELQSFLDLCWFQLKIFWP